MEYYRWYAMKFEKKNGSAFAIILEICLKLSLHFIHKCSG